MKIYNHIKLDIDTWEVIEENSYEYNGIVAECQRDNNSGCPEPKVKECKAWPCNINDTTNEIMIADWCISSSSSSSGVSSSSSSSSSSESQAP